MRPNCKLLLIVCLCQSTSCGPMRNYTNGYHPAGADPRYLNYGLGVEIPGLTNPRVPLEGMSLQARHHLVKYIGVRPDYDYNEDYYESQDSNYIAPPLDAFDGIVESQTNEKPDEEEVPDIVETQVIESAESGYSPDYDAAGGARRRGGKVQCRDEGREFRSGETFFPAGDPCLPCVCLKFGPNCSRIVCEPLPAGCFETIVEPGTCCPVCRRKGCPFRGAFLDLHESVQITACETCQCTESGQLQCTVADCTPPSCVDAVLPQGQCCPVCPNGPNCNSSAGYIIPATVEWVRLPEVPCTECRCRARQGISDQIWIGNRDAQCREIQDCESSDEDFRS